MRYLGTYFPLLVGWFPIGRWTSNSIKFGTSKSPWSQHVLGELLIAWLYKNTLKICWLIIVSTVWKTGKFSFAVEQSQHQKLYPKKWIKGSWNLSHSFLDSSKEPVLPYSCHKKLCNEITVVGEGKVSFIASLKFWQPCTPSPRILVSILLDYNHMIR